MNREEEIWKEYRQIQAKIKSLGLPLEDIRDLLREYDKSSHELAEHRSNQFAHVIEKVVRAGKERRQIGAILRQFAQHVINEARINGMKARDTVEDIVDQIADIDEDVYEQA